MVPEQNEFRRKTITILVLGKTLARKRDKFSEQLTSLSTSFVSSIRSETSFKPWRSSFRQTLLSESLSLKSSIIQIKRRVLNTTLLLISKLPLIWTWSRKSSPTCTLTKQLCPLTGRVCSWTFTPLTSVRLFRSWMGGSSSGLSDSTPSVISR